MVWPHDSDDEKCNFVHDNIDLIQGPPVPRELLPATCVCGRQLTYADEIQFFFVVHPEPTPGTVTLTLTPVVITEDNDDTDPTVH